MKSIVKTPFSTVLSGALTSALFLALAGCSSAPPPAKPAKAGAPETTVTTFAAKHPLAKYLELSGYRVVEASGAGEAIAKLDRHPVSAVVVSLPANGANQLLQEMRRMPSLKSIPVITVGDSGDAANFDACIGRFDRDGLLHSLEQLAAALEGDGASEREPVMAGGRKQSR